MKAILLCEGNSGHPMEDASATWVCMEIEGETRHVLFSVLGLEKERPCDGTCKRVMVDVPEKVEAAVRARIHARRQELNNAAESDASGHKSC